MKALKMLIIWAELCLYLLIYLFPFALTTAQTCGTVLNEPIEHLLEIPANLAAQSRNNQKVRIPLNFYLVSPENNHQVIDLERYELLIEEVNAVFQRANMEFYLCNLPNPVLGKKNHDYLSARELFIDIQQPKTVNIYVVNEIVVPPSETNITGKLLGFASLPSRYNANYRYVFLAGKQFTTALLIHELGHYFGLHHTHQTYFGEELVDGSNCETAGDLICDTPADPNLLTNWSCVYEGTLADENGALYQPDMTNHMSYSRHFCRSSFTEQQFTLMNYHARTSYQFTNFCEGTDDLQDAYSYIAPNPIQDHQLKLFLKNKLRSELKITVWTVLGQQLMDIDAYKQEEDLLFLLNVDKLPKGMFFLTVAYERFQKMETFKFSNY